MKIFRLEKGGMEEKERDENKYENRESSQSKS